MALDEPRETDKIEDINGLSFLVDKDFFEKIQPIKIDYTPLGFKIDCDFDFGGDCSAFRTTCSR